MTTTQAVFPFEPIHLEGAELFCLTLRFGVKTVGGPSFVYNLRFKLII